MTAAIVVRPTERIDMLLTIDGRRCTGCARCSYLCPDLYTMRAGTAVPLATFIPPQMLAGGAAAAKACPAKAIAILKERLLPTPS